MLGPIPVEGEKAGGVRGDEGNDELAGAFELAVEELRAPSQLPQRDADGVANHVAGARPQRSRRGHQGSRSVLHEPARR